MTGSTGTTATTIPPGHLDTKSRHPTPVPGGRRSPRSRWRNGGGLAWYALAAAIAFVVITPIVAYYEQAFVDGAAAIRGLPDIPRLGTTVFNTVVLAAGSTALAVVLALSLAKTIMHVPVRYRRVAAIVPLLPLVVPPVAMVIGWVFIFSPTVGYGNDLLRRLPFFAGAEGPVNIYSMPAITIVTGLDLAGIVFTFIYPRLQEIRGPLEAAAKLAGASALRSFTTITLPLLRPSLVAGTVVAFLLGLGQFTAPALLGSRNGIDVLTTEIFRIRESFPIDYAATAALGLPLLLVGLLSIVAQRLFVGDQRRYVTQTGAGGDVSVATSVWALVGVIGYAVVTVLLPLLAIALVAFSPFWSGDLGSTSFTLDHVNAALSSPEVLSSVGTSALTSILAVLIALPLGFVGALAMTRAFRAPRPAQYLLDVSFLAPLAVPRAVLGLVVLYVFLQPPFSLYGTYTLFVLGYAFVVLPFALRAQHGSLVGVSASLFEASRVSGAGYLRSVLGIALPLARRGMAAAATMMIVLLSHDFAVSVMVRSPGNHVMGTLLYEFWETGVYPQVAVMALVMTVVTGIGLAGTLWIGGRSTLERL